MIEVNGRKYFTRNVVTTRAASGDLVTEFDLTTDPAMTAWTFGRAELVEFSRDGVTLAWLFRRFVDHAYISVKPGGALRLSAHSGRR